MAFMQKAMNKQRERAKQDATVLLRELDEASAAAAAAEGSDSEEETPRNANSSSSSRRGGKGQGRGGAGAWGEDDVAGDKASAKVSKETRAAAAAEVAKALPPGALQSSAVSMDARVRSSVASAITIDFAGKAGDGSGGGGGGGDAPSLGGVGSVKMGGGGGGGKAQSLNTPGDGARAEAMATAGASRDIGRGRRGEAARIIANGNGASSSGRKSLVGRASVADMSGSEEEEEEDQAEARSNPWLQPNPRRSRERRGASNGEVLLDVRKAAATALSAFSGAGDGGKASNGDAEPKEASALGGAGDDARDGSSANGGQAASGQGAGSKKRKKGPGGDGRNGAGGGGKGKQAGPAAAAAAAGGGGGGGGKGKNSNKKAKHADSGSSDSASAAAAAEGKGTGDASVAGAKPALAGLSNDELVRRAFAAPDFDAEFRESKDDEVEAVLSKSREKLPGDVTGWGSWAGAGAPAPRAPTRQQAVANKTQVRARLHFRLSRCLFCLFSGCKRSIAEPRLTAACGSK